MFTFVLIINYNNKIIEAIKLAICKCNNRKGKVVSINEHELKWKNVT